MLSFKEYSVKSEDPSCVTKEENELKEAREEIIIKDYKEWKNKHKELYPNAKIKLRHKRFKAKDNMTFSDIEFGPGRSMPIGVYDHVNKSGTITKI